MWRNEKLSSVVSEAFRGKMRIRLIQYDYHLEINQRGKENLTPENICITERYWKFLIKDNLSN